MTEDEIAIATIYLSEVFNREYFERTWCVQEIVASKQHVAKCGDLEMNFITLLSATPYIMVQRGELLPGKPLEFWNSIYLYKKGNVSSEVPGSMGPLLILLGGLRDFKATNPRDKIFGVLGISDEGIEPHLAGLKIMGNNNSLRMRMTRKFFKTFYEFANTQREQGPDKRPVGRSSMLVPNYTKPTMEIYRDLVRFMLRNSPRILNVLSHVHHREQLKDSTVATWPSWVPKWYEPRFVSLIGSVGVFLAGFCDGHYRYFANIQDNPYLGPALQPNKLIIEGFKIDRVVKTSNAMFFGPQDPFPAEAIWNQLFPGTRLFHSNETETMKTYRNGERLDVAFLLAASVAPLGVVMGFALQVTERPNGVAELSNTRKDMTERLKLQARYNVMAFLLAGTPMDTSEVPQYEQINKEAREGSVEVFNGTARTYCHNRRFFLTQ